MQRPCGRNEPDRRWWLVCAVTCRAGARHSVHSVGARKPLNGSNRAAMCCMSKFADLRSGVMRVWRGRVWGGRAVWLHLLHLHSQDRKQETPCVVLQISPERRFSRMSGCGKLGLSHLLGPLAEVGECGPCCSRQARVREPLSQPAAHPALLGCLCYGPAWGSKPLSRFRMLISNRLGSGAAVPCGLGDPQPGVQVSLTLGCFSIGALESADTGGEGQGAALGPSVSTHPFCLSPCPLPLPGQSVSPRRVR